MLQKIKVCECGKEIVFLRTKVGKPTPVNFDSLNNIEKDDYVNGMVRIFDPNRHVTHFRDCPNAGKYRKSK